MPSYNFRLGFNFSDSYRIASDDTELILLVQDDIEYKLKSGAMDSPLKETPRVAILGGSFANQEEAQYAAEQTKRAILFWAVEQRVGVDFGDGKNRIHLTEEGIRYYEMVYGKPIRYAKHGIDVYEDIDNVIFLSPSCNAKVEKGVDALVSTFKREFFKHQQFSEKQILASEIYASSFFDVGQRSRFVTLVTAVEALIEHEKRSNEIQNLVDEFVRLTKESFIDKSIRQSICGSLDWIRYESIGRAGRALANRLLPTQKYMNIRAGSFFTKAYSLRSSLVHRGAPDNETDILEMANAMQEFVAHLLLASLSSEPDA